MVAINKSKWNHTLQQYYNIHYNHLVTLASSLTWPDYWPRVISCIAIHVVFMFILNILLTIYTKSKPSLIRSFSENMYRSVHNTGEQPS